MTEARSDSVFKEYRERVAIISINRPDALNAMNNDVFAGIADALDEIRDSATTALAIITGVGRAFCAGQDLEEMQAMLDGTVAVHQFPRMLNALTNFPKPLLAAVNGLGVGIGMTLLAHCDLVLMAEDARLKTPFPQLGLAPEAGSSYTFIERMGWQNAAYTLLSGRWFSAGECRDMGIVWRVCPTASVLDSTLEVAQELAENPISSLIATKQLLLASGRPERAWAAHEREVLAYDALLGGAANKEAVAAFLEKRAPDFKQIKGL